MIKERGTFIQGLQLMWQKMLVRKITWLLIWAQFLSHLSKIWENAQLPVNSLFSFLTLSNLILVPNIKNIIFIFKLIDNTNFFIEFTPFIYVKDLTKKTFAEETCRGNIYIFKESSSSFMWLLPSFSPSQKFGALVVSS